MQNKKLSEPLLKEPLYNLSSVADLSYIKSVATPKELFRKDPTPIFTLNFNNNNTTWTFFSS